MKRTFLLALVVATAVTACTSNVRSEKLHSSASCSTSGTGTTDLGKKPEIKPPSSAAPKKTTTIDIVCGTGEEAKDGSKVDVKYVGVLYNGGKEFDSSWSRGPNETLPFTIGGGVIPGFSKGVTGMKVGGRREIIIPAKDGYGENPSGPIPAGSTLVFVVDLVKIAGPVASTPCTPSGSGSTDLSTKPVVKVPTTPAPAETKVIDIVCGTGKQADEGSNVEVKYVGVLYVNGKEFDSSWKRGPNQTLPFMVGGGVIPGFSKGVTGMKIGGRREVIIPAKDGYGPTASGPIPANSTLIFVIDLVKVS